MPGNFTSPDGDLSSIFVDDYAMIDQYAKTGSLWTVGKATAGGLGNNTTAPHQSSPVQTVAGGTNWKTISCGHFHNAGIKTDGTLWMWGDNQYGALGDNTRTNRASPVLTAYGATTDWKSVACGFLHTLAIKTDGSLWTWGGYNVNYGHLGDGTRVSKSIPTQITSGGNDWKMAASGYYMAGAIKNDGTLWMWGNNNYGQLGTNNRNTYSNPTQTVAGGTDWKSLSCSWQHSAAIKTDGSLWFWGNNKYGQFGNGVQYVYTSSPAQTVTGGANWKTVVTGSHWTTGIKTDGTLWSMGRNLYGQVGDNTNGNIVSTPVQTIAAGTNWKTVSTRLYTVSATKTDGTLWIWGKNEYGQLGIGNITHKSSPVQMVTGGNNWKLTAVSGYHTAAIYNYDAGNLYPSA